MRLNLPNKINYFKNISKYIGWEGLKKQDHNFHWLISAVYRIEGRHCFLDGLLLVQALVWMDTGETRGEPGHTGEQQPWCGLSPLRKERLPAPLNSISHVNMGRMPGSHVPRNPAATGCRVSKTDS